MTYGQAIQLLVHGLALEQNPAAGSPSNASDYFAKIDDKSWYASSFLIAVQNSLSLDKATDPNAAVTRAKFAQLLDEALKAKGDFPVTEMYFNIADGGKLSAEVDGSLQTLLNMRILSLETGASFARMTPLPARRRPLGFMMQEPTSSACWERSVETIPQVQARAQTSKWKKRQTA